MKKKIERKLQLKKEGISQLQPNELSRIRGGGADAQKVAFTSIASCVTNQRTCGANCCHVLSTELAGECGTISRGCGCDTTP